MKSLSSLLSIELGFPSGNFPKHKHAHTTKISLQSCAVALLDLVCFVEAHPSSRPPLCMSVSLVKETHRPAAHDSDSRGECCRERVVTWSLCFHSPDMARLKEQWQRAGVRMPILHHMLIQGFKG